MVTVAAMTFPELTAHPDFPALFREYASESAMEGLPPPDDKMAQYEVLANSGIFHIHAAFAGESLIGFIAFLLPVIPHYGVAIGVAESFFVGQKHRKGGAGLKLLNAAEDHAKSAGSLGLMASAPIGSRLAEVLPRRGYRETNRVFLKVFE